MCEVIHELITKEAHYCPFLSQGRPPGVPPLKLTPYPSCENLSGHVIYPNLSSVFDPSFCFKTTRKSKESQKISYSRNRQMERPYFTSTLLSPLNGQHKDFYNAQVPSQGSTRLPAPTTYSAQLSMDHFLYPLTLSPPPVIIDPVVSLANEPDKVGQYSISANAS